jgi:hypothetical protein
MKQIWILIACLWIISIGVITVTWQMFQEGCRKVDEKIDKLFEGLL